MSVGTAANYLFVKFPFLAMKSREDDKEPHIFARDNVYRVSLMSDEMPKNLKTFKRDLHKELIHLELLLWGTMTCSEDGIEFTVVGDADRKPADVKEYILSQMENDCDDKKRKRTE